MRTIEADLSGIYLCQHLREKKILILGSYCCEENEYLKKFIHNLQLTDDFLGIIKMQGIDLNTSFTIIKYWLGDFEDAYRVAEKLYRVSGENPFFLSELLRWIVESSISLRVRSGKKALAGTGQD